MCLSCPNPLVKMDITFCQNRHFDQVGPPKRSWFFIVLPSHFKSPIPQCQLNGLENGDSQKHNENL